jgi:hypothetical protein
LNLENCRDRIIQPTNPTTQQALQNPPQQLDEAFPYDDRLLRFMAHFQGIRKMICLALINVIANRFCDRRIGFIARHPTDSTCCIISQPNSNSRNSAQLQ